VSGELRGYLIETYTGQLNLSRGQEIDVGILLCCYQFKSSSN